MMPIARVACLTLAAFLLGFATHFLYRRWSAPATPGPGDNLVHPVVLLPSSPQEEPPAKALPVLQASDRRRIRELAGQRARVRGRIYRVGHSARSNTYFLNFAPTREGFTAVVFASAAQLFERRKIDLLSYEGKTVELTGEIKDDPKYGLEMIIEDPSQIRVLR